MCKQLLHILMVCLISFSLSGCLVGYKTFSVDDKHPAPPASGLENIKLSCTSDGGSLPCDSIQYVLRTQYHILDVQTIKTDGEGRFSVHVEYKDEISKASEIWAGISGFSFSIIPAVVSEDRIYRFTITSPTGESRSYGYRFTERSYNWLPLIAFTLFVPGYYLDMTVKYDSYIRKRTSVFEDSIIPRLMTDAGPFLISQVSRTIK